MADFGLSQQRVYQTPANGSLPDMGVYNFEDDRSEYSCLSVAGAPALS